MGEDDLVVELGRVGHGRLQGPLGLVEYAGQHRQGWPGSRRPWLRLLSLCIYILDIDNRFLVPNAIVVQVRQNGKLSKDSQITCDRQGRYLEAWATKNLIDKVN